MQTFTMSPGDQLATKCTMRCIEHMLVDRRHCINVCDVRSIRGAEIESEHFLLMAKIR